MKMQLELVYAVFTTERWFSERVPSVGGSAMHMKWPGGIGREAGIGKNRNRKELSVFRACPR